MSKEKENNFKKKLSSKGLIYAISFIAIVGGGLLLYRLMGSSSIEKLADASEHSLEQYVLETYSGDESLNDIVYGFSNISDENNLYITDFATTEDFVEDSDLQNFAGTVEFSEINHVYHFANGNVSDDAPRVDNFTRRIPIVLTEGKDIPLIYQNVFYNGIGELDVSSEYFIGDIDYAVIQQFDYELGEVTSIRYVLDKTYPYVIAELNITESKSVDVSEVTIGDVEYLRYEIVQSIE